MASPRRHAYAPRPDAVVTLTDGRALNYIAALIGTGAPDLTEKITTIVLRTGRPTTAKASRLAVDARTTEF